MTSFMILAFAFWIFMWAIHASIKARAKEQGAHPPTRSTAYHAGRIWDVSGPLRAIRDGEQWYVVGQGYVAGPINDPAEAGRLVATLSDLERKGGRA